MDNQFDSKGGTQNIAQGDGAIGSQTNNIHHHCYSRTAQGIPLQRPQLAEHFKGRKAVLARLLPLLQPGKAVTLCGPGGMGKTALAAQAAWRLAPGKDVPACFPDGIIFYSFYGKHTAEEALAHIVRSYDEQQQDTSPDAARRLLASKQALLILDGTEEADNLTAVLKVSGMCGVLITSRKKEDAPVKPLHITPLAEQAAEMVFRLHSGTAADTATVQDICGLLGGWPVALRIAGRYLSSTGESAADYLRFLRQQPFRRLDKGEHGQENAALLLRRSVDAVSADARLALGLAGCLAFAPLAREPMAAMFEGDELRSADALGELVNYGLLEKHGERWQISHALIHAYAREELALSKESLERLANWYIVKGYAILDGERAHCLRLMESCLASKLRQEVKLLVRIMFEHLDRQGWWTDMLVAVGMRLTAAQQAGDRKDEGWCLNSLGYTCERRGEREQALSWYEQSLPICRELGDQQGESVLLNNIAMIYNDQSKHELALEHYKQSLSIRREVGDQEGEGVTMNNIANVYMHQGGWEQALPYLEQCLSIMREIGDKRGEGITLNNIAAICDAQGKPAKALEHHEQALAIRLEIGDRAGEAESRWNIGTTYANLGDLAKAEEHISQAVQIAGQIGHLSLEKYRDGLVTLRCGQHGKARRRHADSSRPSVLTPPESPAC